MFVTSVNMRVSAKAPCRVDLAGATLDIWPLYLFHDNVVTLNFAVDLFTGCNVETRDDSRIVLRSAILPAKKLSNRWMISTQRSIMGCRFSRGWSVFLRLLAASQWNPCPKLHRARGFRVHLL